MSELSVDYTDRLNLRDVLARIDRAQAETRKFVAEHDKLAAERSKLDAEAAKLRRERFLAPILAADALGGFIAAAVPLILRSWWVH